MVCRKCRKEIPDESTYCNRCGAKQSVSRVPKKRGNGQGTVYKRGQTWTAKHTLYRNGCALTRAKGGFETKRDALAWLSSPESFVVPDRPLQKTFSEIYDEWSDRHYDSISAKKTQAYKAAYRTCSKLHPLYWDEIALADMQDAVDAAKNAHYPRKNVRTILHLMESFAIKHGYTSRQIAKYLEIPSKPTPNKKAFSDADIRKLFNAHQGGDSFAGAILILIHTGMRYGEISTILPENIHLEESYMTGGIKTEAGKNGEILILDAIKPIVKELMLPVNQLAQMSDTTFRSKFYETLERYGCEPHTIHECRHTTATLLARAGIQPAIIKEIMRHASYEQTLEYTHIDRATKLKALKSAHRRNSKS